jgi:hypothetical protein
MSDNRTAYESWMLRESNERLEAELVDTQERVYTLEELLADIWEVLDEGQAMLFEDRMQDAGLVS